MVTIAIVLLSLFLFSNLQVDDVPFADVPNVIGNYDMCIVKNMRLNADVISHASRMKLIMQYGVGLEGYLFILVNNCNFISFGYCSSFVYSVDFLLSYFFLDELFKNYLP